MQRADSENSVGTARPARILVLLVTAVAVGCGGDDQTPNAVKSSKPLAGAVVRVACPDPVLAAVLRPMARSWAGRTGAAVELVGDAMAPGDNTDVGIVPFADLGGWADRGDLAPLPPAIKESKHPLQWSGLLPAYRGEPFAGWGAQVYGLPVAGDGLVLVYRDDRFKDKAAADAFQTKYSRPLGPPGTWEDLADAAAFFAERDKSPSMPPLPADPARLADLFFRVAAGFDRAVQREVGKVADAVKGDALSFAFDAETGAPRLDQPGFKAAADWLAGLKARGCVPPAGPSDPVALLKDGKAVLAVLTLAEVAKLRPGGGTVDQRFGVAPVPGTRGYAEAGGRVVPVTGNYVPFVNGGWVGVVRARSASAAAGFDLLADLAGPARSNEVVAATGYGPTRSTHLDRDRLIVWLGYGFDPDRSRALQDAAEGYVAKTARNPAFGLRTPDHTALTAALAADLRAVADGTAAAADAMARAAAAWQSASPAARERDRRRRAVGLN